MSHPYRRELLLGTLGTFLAAVFPWLRRKKVPERYLYQLAKADCGSVRLYPSIRQQLTIGSDSGTGIIRRADAVETPFWRFHDYRIEWKVDPNADGFVLARRAALRNEARARYEAGEYLTFDEFIAKHERKA